MYVCIYIYIYVLLLVLYLLLPNLTPARVQFMVVLRRVKPHSTCSVERQISVMVKPNASLFIELPKSLPETAMDSMDTNIIHTRHDNTHKVQ